uniref:Uncharacterized protein n=1 Tax=Arundo donax TaxID=35708 RepID=A0A0A9ACY4_ARUDO
MLAYISVHSFITCIMTVAPRWYPTSAKRAHRGYFGPG